MRLTVLSILFLSIPAMASILNAYTDSRDCYSRMGKYEEIAVWCKGAALEPVEPVSISGDPLTVKIWMAVREGDAPAHLSEDVD